MSYQLYADQQELLERVREAFTRHKRVVMQMPTGAGKTIIAGTIMQGLHARGGKALVLVHRRELMDQFYDTLAAAGLAEHIGRVQAGLTEVPYQAHQIASVQTLVRRLDKTRIRPSFIIVDEAHHIRAATYKKIIDRFPEAQVLGLTATPERLDGKGLDTAFDSLVCSLDTAELIRRGRLAPYEGMGVPILSGQGLKVRAGDYAKDELERIATGKALADVANAIVKHAAGRRAIVFNASRRASRRLVARLEQRGITAAHIDGDTPLGEREQVLRQFAEGQINALCNVDLISEGFDAPACDAVVFARPTKSLTVYLQQAGRGMRPDPDKPGKRTLFLDCAGLIAEHGEPGAPRTWSLAGRGKRQAQPPKPRICRCRVCGMRIPTPASQCQACGFQVQLVQAPGKPELQVELIRVCGIDFQVERAHGGSYKKPSVAAAAKHAWRAGGAEALRELGKKLGYRPGWADLQIAMRTDSRVGRNRHGPIYSYNRRA